MNEGISIISVISKIKVQQKFIALVFAADVGGQILLGEIMSNGGLRNQDVVVVKSDDLFGDSDDHHNHHVIESIDSLSRMMPMSFLFVKVSVGILDLS